MSLSRLSLDFYTRCWRCNQGISSDSFFAVQLWPEYERLNYDIVMANKLHRDDLAVHMNGDRECTKEVSGYHGKILKRLDLSMSCDTAFLDTV
jgi:hypothetical protein